MFIFILRPSLLLGEEFILMKYCSAAVSCVPSAKHEWGSSVFQSFSSFVLHSLFVYPSPPLLCLPRGRAPSHPRTLNSFVTADPQIKLLHLHELQWPVCPSPPRPASLCFWLYNDVMSRGHLTSSYLMPEGSLRVDGSCNGSEGVSSCDELVAPLMTSWYESSASSLCAIFLFNLTSSVSSVSSAHCFSFCHLPAPLISLLFFFPLLRLPHFLSFLSSLVVSLCSFSSQLECDNFITVIEKVNDTFIVCGTNAGSPRCWMLVRQSPVVLK